MKVLSKSDFSFREFTEGKRALFIVNPDEKKLMIELQVYVLTSHIKL
mgnify:CR=1 FL=1